MPGTELRDPVCIHCGGKARMNVLMFDDWSWVERRKDQQDANYGPWVGRLAASKAKVVILEIGCGSAVATGRRESSLLARETRGTIIRVNPEDPGAPTGHLGIKMGALAFLEKMRERA
jgi:hypothetical protein